MWIVVEGSKYEGCGKPEKVFCAKDTAWEEACRIACSRIGDWVMSESGFDNEWGYYISVEYIELCNINGECCEED